MEKLTVENKPIETAQQNFIAKSTTIYRYTNKKKQYKFHVLLGVNLYILKLKYIINNDTLDINLALNQ
jgi:hypothetical protein